MSEIVGKNVNAGWRAIKAKLAGIDRAGLLGLIQDLYAASRENQAFMNARFDLGGDVLKPYKATIAFWLWPDGFKNQNTSVAKAKKAISNYKKAGGQQIGLAELMVFYCEQATGFGADVGLQDDAYFDALIRMCEQALKVIDVLPQTQRSALWFRLDALRRIGHDLGYGVGDDMDQLLASHGIHA